MIKKEPWIGGTDEEYETQHFGFGFQRFKIALRQMVEEKIKTNFAEMESCLQTSGKLTGEESIAVTEACEKLVRMYCDRAGPCLVNIDIDAERMLKIPHNVLLPEDEIQLQQTTDQDYEKLQEEVRHLRNRVERNSLMTLLLTMDLEEMASVETVCEMAKKDMEGVDILEKSLDRSAIVKKLLNELLFLKASMQFEQGNDETNIII